MALLTIMAAAVAPRFTGFVEGQKYDAEWRRLLSDLRFARSEAISRSIPVELWFSADGKTYGFARQESDDASWMPDDREMSGAIMLEFRDEEDRQVVSNTRVSTDTRRTPSEGEVTIRFWPDGSVDADSPWYVRMIDGDVVREVERDLVQGYVPVERVEP